MPEPKNHLKLIFMTIQDNSSLCEAKQNKLHEPENAIVAMKNRGFLCNQATPIIHVYGEMKSLVIPLDRRWYG